VFKGVLVIQNIKLLCQKNYISNCAQGLCRGINFV